MGVIGDRTGSLGYAFYLVPLCYLALAMLMGYDWPQLSRRKSNPVGQKG